VAGERLHDLLAEALGILDPPARVRVGREQRRLGLAFVQCAGDRRVPSTRRPSIFSAGTVVPGKPRSLTSSRRCAPGIRSRRVYGMPLWRSIASAMAAFCDPGMPYSFAFIVRLSSCPDRLVHLADTERRFCTTGTLSAFALAEEEAVRIEACDRPPMLKTHPCPGTSTRSRFVASAAAGTPLLLQMLADPKQEPDAAASFRRQTPLFV
jgi:hypothetical protein